MKAAVYEGERSIRVQERPDPKAAPGEVIVKVKYCGICGTDVHAYLHESMIPPRGIVLGHENVGTIAETGEGVTGWKVGERVAVGPPGPCGECYYCRHGQPGVCVHAFERTIGLSPGCDGGMAEYIRVRYPDDMLHRIPDEVSFEDAVLLDTICVSLRGVQQSRFRLGDNVVVIGAGAIGLTAIQLLKIGGARHITVLQPSPAKRELALQLGADLALSPAEEGEGLQQKIMSLYGGIGADIVFECAGTPESFQSCFNFVKNRGQVLLLGVTELPVPIVEGMLVIKEIDVRATLAYGADEIDFCLDLLAKRRFNTRGMLSDIISLDDIVEKGFERLISTKGLVKIAVAP